jgi:hypothetical protein
MDDNIDYMDGYDERMNPYDGKCPIHGSWKGPIDECPKCLDQSIEESMQHEYDWVPAICGDCKWFDICDMPHCRYYNFWTPKFEKKKSCIRKEYDIPNEEDKSLESFYSEVGDSDIYKEESDNYTVLHKGDYE